MFRLWMLVCVFAFALTVPTNAADEVPKKDDTTNQIVDVLLSQEVALPRGNLNDIPLLELLSSLSAKHALTFVINEERFKEVDVPNIKEEKPRLATTQLNGLRLHQFLRVTLDSMGATYLIRNNTIEIVPTQYAAKVTQATLQPTDNKDARTQLSEPLVSFVVKEKPLNEAVEQIAKLYDLTVVVSPQSGDARMGFVSARLLNMPADKALELLTLQADLRVVRRGAAFLITSKDHANEIFGEELEKERQKIELQKFREMPVKPLKPEKTPMPPAPKP
jgi:type II secretory pathway component GspD/PulD (secretin)